MYPMKRTCKPVSLQIWGKACYYFSIILLLSNTCFAQNIILKNPSMEGHPGRDSIPGDWVAASNTPDIFPGVFSIFKPASNGSTYVGLHSGPTYSEGIAQQLTSDLQGGSAYSLSLYMAFAPKYLYQTCYG